MKDYIVTHYVVGIDEYFIVKANNSKEAINLVYDTLYDKSYMKSNFKAKSLDDMYKYANECCDTDTNKKLSINNKSLEFIKNRIKNNQTFLNLDDFDGLYQMNVYDIINKEDYENTNGFLSNASITLDDKVSECEIRLKIDENSEYDYFTMCSCVCDGSFFAVINLMEQCIYKIKTLQTYYKKVEVNMDTVKDKILQYTVGNFVVGYKNSSEFAPSDKPWMTEKLTVMLPIKFEILDKER